MKKSCIALLVFPLAAAAPLQQPLSLSVGPTDSFSIQQTAPKARGPAFQPAPLPNRDVSTPQAARASSEPSLAPTLFTTRNQFRGDGFSPGSTAQSEQEHRLKPGAGISLHMPFSNQ